MFGVRMSLPPIRGAVGPAEVVRQEEDDVRPRRRGPAGRAHRRQEQGRGEQASRRSHGPIPIGARDSGDSSPDPPPTLAAHDTSAATGLQWTVGSIRTPHHRMAIVRFRTPFRLPSVLEAVPIGVYDDSQLLLSGFETSRMLQELAISMASSYCMVFENLAENGLPGDADTAESHEDSQSCVDFIAKTRQYGRRQIDTVIRCFS